MLLPDTPAEPPPLFLSSHATIPTHTGYVQPIVDRCTPRTGGAAVMRARTIALLGVTHLAVAVAGFGAGVYALPILIAPKAPSLDQVRSATGQTAYTGKFRRDLKDSDALHWGEGDVSVSSQAITLAGKLAPGPDYKLYLSPEFVETEAAFKELKPRMLRIGDVKTFENFVVAVPAGTDVAAYSAVVVWCETFGQFITAARYR